MSGRIVVGSRGSKLAMIQAESVVAKLREIRLDIEVNIRPIVTSGDRNRRTQLDRMPDVGVFVKELEDALLEGRIDLAVHSLKDMPTQIPEGLRLAAAIERLDPRDVLVSRGGRLAELASGAKIGTSSLRRAVQLNVRRPDLKACGIRGNVDTRLRKVANGEFNGVIVAAAGLKRLGQEAVISEYLPIEQFLPAVGQGALAMETRLADEEINKIVALLNHLPTWQSITAERTFLRALGGGCRAPIAALGTINGKSLRLEGMVADINKKKILRSWEEGSNTAPEEVGLRLSQKLLGMGAEEYLAEAAEDENR